MRTTLNLSDGLMEAAKRRAKVERRTLTSFIEDAVRKRLDETIQPTVAEMPVFAPDGGRGLLVDLLDRDAVERALEDDATR